MTISKTHFQLATNLKLVDVLNNPQKYLGPYTNHLLQFWNQLDTLTEEQWKTIENRHWDFYCNHNYSYIKVGYEGIIDAYQMIGVEFADNVYNAMDYVYNSGAAHYATNEIIGGVEEPVFLKMFDDL